MHIITVPVSNSKGGGHARPTCAAVADAHGTHRAIYTFPVWFTQLLSTSQLSPKSHVCSTLSHVALHRASHASWLASPY